MKSVIATLFGTVLLSGAAIAAMPLEHGGAKSSAPAFEQLDQNKDGALSESEASRVPGLDFKKADTNHDRKLSRAEYETAAASKGS